MAITRVTSKLVPVERPKIVVEEKKTVTIDVGLKSPSGTATVRHEGI